MLKKDGGFLVETVNPFLPLSCSNCLKQLERT